MGTSRLLSSFAGATMFWFSGTVGETLGIHNVLLLSLASVGCRFSLLVTMNHPYYAYLAEMIRGGLFGVYWSAATVYASEQIGPPTLRAMMLLLLNGMYEGMGRSTGAILGGKIQAIVGTETLFLYVALGNGGLALVMFLCKALSSRAILLRGYSPPTTVNGLGTTVFHMNGPKKVQ
jgi:MFS_1 like family